MHEQMDRGTPSRGPGPPGSPVGAHPLDEPERTRGEKMDPGNVSTRPLSPLPTTQTRL
jgi:hypothetical protein